MQIDNLSELPSDKRPPELLIWDGNSDELEKWITDVMTNKKHQVAELIIKDDEIEG